MYRNSEEMETKRVGNTQWRTRGWLLILSICLIFGVTSTAIFGMFRDNAEPKEEIIEVFANLLDSDTLDITLTSGLEGFDLGALKEEAPELEEKIKMMNDIRIDMRVKVDKKNLILESNVDVAIADTHLVSGRIYMDRELIGVYMPQVHKKVIYLTWEDAFMIGAEQEANIIIWESFFDIFDTSTYVSIKNFDQEPYRKLIEELIASALGDVTKEDIIINGKKQNCHKYNLQIQGADLLDTIVKLGDKLLQDKQVRAFVYEVVDRIGDKLVENDYKDKETMDRYKEEAKRDIDSDMDDISLKALTSINIDPATDYGLNTWQVLLEGFKIAKYDTDFYVDKQQNICLIENISLIESIIRREDEEFNSLIKKKQVLTINALGKPITFEGVDKKKAISLTELTMKEIMTIIENGLGSNLEILHRMMY